MSKEKLRVIVRSALKHKASLIESKVRSCVRRTLVLNEAEANRHGIQVLEDMLLPYVSDGGLIKKTYVSLKASPEQRLAFRHALLNSLENILKLSVNLDHIATRSDKIKSKRSGANGFGYDLKERIWEGLEIDLGADDSDYALDPENPVKKIDQDEEGEPEEVDKFSPKTVNNFEEMSDDEKTGVTAALKIASSMEKQIATAIEELFGEDEELFSEYLLINVSLFLDKFEEDMTAIEEPEGLERLDTEEEL